MLILRVYPSLSFVKVENCLSERVLMMKMLTYVLDYWAIHFVSLLGDSLVVLLPFGMDDGMLRSS